MRNAMLTLAVLAMGVIAGGCAITDFSGFPDHNTQSEAKLWGTEIAFNTGDDNTGTYAYTVKYDNRAGQGTVTINSYKNDVFSSFGRDGVIDRDGDDVQGSSGEAGGKFLPWFRAVDVTGGGTCEFFDNITFDKSATGAGVALCSTTNEEIDKDLDLQTAFASVGDLLDQIWSGAVSGAFTMEVTSLELDGVTVPVDTFSITARSNGLRPIQLAVDLTQPAGNSLIQAVLDNTNHLEPVTLALNFDGGMTFRLPANARVAFNHDSLLPLLQ